MKTEIEKYNPCQEALEFRRRFATFKEAWDACPRGGWMLWIAQKLDVDPQTITLAKGHCANTVRHLMKDKNSLIAVDTAIAFGEGSATIHELKDAAAYAADAHAAAHAAAYVAYAAAAYAAYACAAAHAAAYVVYACAAAAYAAADDAADACVAIKHNQKHTADICRKYLTDDVIEKILNQQQ